MDREGQVEALKKQRFDILVIGGGATGTGIALDAASRGLSAALVERFDFASGTSSKSTKLIHGGVRYLERALLRFDRSQFRLVRDALHERSTLLKIAPHLVHPLGILTPLYRWMQVPYYTTGLRLYDRLAGKSLLRPSRFLDALAVSEKVPQLNVKHLKGGVLYYDGQFDDARMNVCLALTAQEAGAIVANYIEVLALHKENKKISGVRVRDSLSGQEWDIETKAVINATGPYVDKIRQMEDASLEPILTASSGTHLVLPAKYCSSSTGILVPKTDDGRVLFLLPWLGHTLVGTTDLAAKITDCPRPQEEEVEFLLQQVKKYLWLEIPKQEIQSSWCGLRPLVSDPKASDTAKLSRDHVIHVSLGNLITIAGGKWTTYRKMALDAVNEAVRVANLKQQSTSRTAFWKLAGADHFSDEGLEALTREHGLDPDVAAYLHRAYGDRANRVAEIARQGYSKRLNSQHPYVEAEVVYAAQQESARSPQDFLARRIRLAFLDKGAARAAAPRVAELLAESLGSRLEFLKDPKGWDNVDDI